MDKFSKPTRSRIMSRIRSKDTKPEMALRKMLHKEGLRFRVQYGAEKIDIAFTQKKIAIFVDGCFWHQCPEHSHIPKSNTEYWIPKLEKNAKRSKEKDGRLIQQGWTIMHFWEHEIKEDPEACVNKVKRVLREA